MSQIERQPRVTSDFSIARILAEDSAKKSRESFFFAQSEGFLPRSASLQDLRSDGFSRRESNGSRSFDSFGLVAAYADDDRRASVHQASFSNFRTTGGATRDERISALKSSPGSSAPENNTVKIERSELSWLHCTRYRPPKLPRKSTNGKSGKRRPGTHPRIPFTATQLQVLEDKYRSTAYLSRRDVLQLSTALRLPQSRVKIWFQNRRARDRRESSTVSGSNILSNDAPVVDKTKGVPSVPNAI